MDGVLISSSVAFCGDNSVCAGGNVSGFTDGLFDTFGAGGNDFGYMDNYVVNSVPEPSTLLLLAAGLPALLLRRSSR